MEYVIIYQIILLIYLEIKSKIINIIKYTTICVQFYNYHVKVYKDNQYLLVYSKQSYMN